MMMSGGVQPTFNFVGVKSPNFYNWANLANHGNNALITAVKVCWSDSIVGMELFFNGSSAGLVKGNVANTWDEVFTLTPGDFIVQIFGRHSNVINCLGFRTAKGFTKVWGNPCTGESFTLGLNGQYIKSLVYGVHDFLTYIEPVFGDADFLLAKPVPMCANGKLTQALGRSGTGAEAFDDAAWVSQMFNYTLAEVKVFHDGNSCYGIQTFYLMDGTKKSPGTHMIFANNLKAESLVLSEDEHITRAIIRAGEWVDSITLYTDKGKKFHVGGTGGEPYAVIAPNGMQIVSFNGTLGTQLSRLQVQLDEIY